MSETSAEQTTHANQHRDTERERDIHTQTHALTDTHTHRHTHTYTDTQTHTHTDTHPLTHTHTHTHCRWPYSGRNLVEDGKAAVQYLKDAGVRETNIVLHGHSLGGGVATQVAHHFKDTMLIHERSFRQAALPSSSEREEEGTEKGVG